MNVLNKIKVIFCLSLLLLSHITAFKVYAQKIDGCKIAINKMYSIKSNVLLNTIDSLAAVVSSCPPIDYFNENLMVILDIKNDSSCRLIITPECCTQLFKVMLGGDVSTLGVCKNSKYRTFIIAKNANHIDKFCSLTSIKRKIKLKNTSNLFNQVMPPISYELTMKGSDIMIEELSTKSCNEYYYVYQVKKGDTWQNLNKKFHCDFGKFNQNLPILIESVYLTFDFYFDNEKIVDVKVW